jgi:hypothetical protein
MIFKFITVILCLLCNLGFANNEVNQPKYNSINGKIIERHLLENGNWNLFIELNDEEKTSGWVDFNPEIDFRDWKFYDLDHDLTKNMELSETLEIQNKTPNSNFLKATPRTESFKLIKPLSEEDDLRPLQINKITPKANQRKSYYPLIPDRKNWSYGCTNFIDEQGIINSWGLSVIQAINRYPEYLSSGSKDMQNYCPNFSKFNKSEKENFWVWFIAAMAMRESACRPDVKAKGPNGTAAGLLQLHLHKEYAYHEHCQDTNALIPHENLNCGTAMFDAQLIRFNRMFLSNGSYWQVLQTDISGNGVRKLISLYRPCR